MAESTHKPTGRPLARSAFSRLVGRVGTHTSIYGIAAITNLLAGLASVAIVTRYLVPSDYGRLAILLAWASILTVVLNAGTLTGTNSWVFGSSGEEDEAIQGDDAERARDPRRALATGLALTLSTGVFAVLAVWAAAGPLAKLLIGAPAAGGLVVLAAGAGALAAIWRLAANVIRLQRRPWSYLVAIATQHVLAIVLAVPFLAAGGGVHAALLGMLLGNGVAAVLSVGLIRADLRLAVSRRDAIAILRLGRPLVPMTAGLYFIQLADVLVLSRFVSNGQVGLYRVAVRLAALVSYWTASFHMAWGAMRRDPLHLAAENERGFRGVVRPISTCFALVTFGVILAISLFSEEMIRIFAPGYGDAASLIPLAAVGWACYGFYVLVYRTVEFPSKRAWFVGLTVIAAFAFLLSAQLWIRLIGTYGISAAVITAWFAAILVLVWRGHRHAAPAPYASGRVLTGLLLALTCFTIAKRFAPSGDWTQFSVDLAALSAYPALLICLRVVPPSEVSAAATTLAGWRVARPPRSVSPEDHALLDALLRQRRPVRDLSSSTGVSEDEIHGRLGAALRRWYGLDAPQGHDAAIAAHLLLCGAFVQREDAARALYASGIDPLEVEAFIAAARSVRRTSKRRWRAAVHPDATSWPSATHRHPSDDGSRWAS